MIGIVVAIDENVYTNTHKQLNITKEKKNRLLIKKIEFLSFNREYIKIIVVWESLRTETQKK